MKNEEKNDWLNKSVYYQWITFERPMDVKAYAKKELDLAEKLGAGTYLYYIQCAGKVIYNSELAERAAGLDGDLLRALENESRKKGIKLVVGWLATLPACSLEGREHPDWITKRPDGKIFSASTLCYNSPYRDYLFAQIGEILDNYAVDGIYFDQCPSGCFCDYCKQQYKERYGEEMPALKNEQVYSKAGAPLYPLPGEAAKYGLSKNISRRLYDFSTAIKQSWTWNIRRVIKEKRPSCALIMNRIEHINAASVKDEVDAFLPESGRPWSFSFKDTTDLAMELEITALYSGKTLWGVVKCDKYGVRGYPLDRIKRNLAGTVSNNHVPVIRDQDCFSFKLPQAQEAIFKSMQEMDIVRDAMRKLPGHAYAAILHSKNSYHFSCETTDNSFYGISSFLIERHIPFKYVREEDIQDGLTDVRLLIIPNSICLAEETLNSIAGYYEHGGNIFFTARSGMLDETEKPHSRDVLAELVGIRRINWRSNVKPYPVVLHEVLPIPALHHANFSFVKVADAGHSIINNNRNVWTDFNYGYMETENISGNSLAQVCSFKQSGVMSKHFNRRIPFPGKPISSFLVAAENKGRCVYFAAPVGDAKVRINCDELEEIMEQAVKWCGGALFIEPVNLPPSIKMTVKGGLKDKKMIVLLHSMVVIGTKAIGANNVILNLNCPAAKIKSCKSLLQGKIEIRKKGDRSEILVKEVQPYEAIDIEFV